MSSRDNLTNVRRSRSGMFRLYMVMLVVSLITIALFSFVTALSAKYTTYASGNDSARVAQFKVVAADADADASKDLQLGYTTTEQTYAFTVANQNDDGSVINEVDTKYDVEVKFPSSITCVSSSITNGTGSSATTVNGQTTDNTTYTFSNVGSFKAATGKTDTLTLKFALDTTKMTTGEWSGVTVTVKAAQTNQ